MAKRKTSPKDTKTKHNLLKLKRIGVLTSGGEGAGMNACVRAVTRYALGHGVEVMGVFRGYDGLMNEEIKPLTHRSVSGVINEGGTFLKTSRSPEFMTDEGQRRAVRVIKKFAIDALVIIGGDGSYRGAICLERTWHVPCVGVPGTIDNDISGTDSTIGSDTAVNVALDAIDKIRDTATSMERIFVVEVMGRNYGFIAMQVALAGGVEEVLLPGKKFDMYEICHAIVEGNLRGKVSWIIVVAEGAAKAVDIAAQIQDMTGLETREVTLGHIQRGGSPTARDRVLATRLGASAVDLLLQGESGKAVGVDGDRIVVVDLETAVEPKEFRVQEIYGLMKALT
jgi:6-phosphofructokinase 1